MRKVLWNNQAKLDYFENIDFLLQKWSEKEAQKFIDHVQEIEFLLKQGNIDFQKTDFKGVNRCVVMEQISLFYRITDDIAKVRMYVREIQYNGNIELLRFWNNAQNQRRLKL